MAIKPKVHLILGSGGARGIAHIGVIERLEEEGYEIAEVIGCSMGAIVGALFAAGHLKDYKEWLMSLSKSAIWKMMDFTLTKQGFVKGDRLFAPMTEVVGPRLIEELSIPFTAVATNMNTREEVCFRKGDLYQALRASISIPGLFTPVKINDEVLVDGGVLNPLPVNLLRHKESGAITVAVNINAKTLEEHCPAEGEIKNTTSNNWIPLQWPFSKKKNGKTSENFSVIDLMQTTFDFTQDRLTEAMLELHPPDVLIDVPRTTCGILEFHRAAEIIELGRQSFDTAFAAYENHLNQA